MMDFTSALQKFNGKTMRTCDRVLQESVIGLTQDMVDGTPVQSGAARSNYFWGINRETRVDNGAVSVDGRPSMERARAFASGLKAGGVVYVSNSLSYIYILEFGTSSSAPHAMMRAAASRWKQIGAAAERRAMR